MTEAWPVAALAFKLHFTNPSPRLPWFKKKGRRGGREAVFCPLDLRVHVSEIAMGYMQLTHWWNKMVRACLWSIVNVPVAFHWY